jgi:hypothetical protein
MVLVPSLVYIVGDIHGQLDDLLYLFGRVDALPVGPAESSSQSAPDRVLATDQLVRLLRFDRSKHFVFMGGSVDHGYHSLNTFLCLACLKIEFPEAIYLLRGNHESRQILKHYGFYDECVLTYGHTGL